VTLTRAAFSGVVQEKVWLVNVRGNGRGAVGTNGELLQSGERSG
jgi:hypothetical protein